jgi:hypothetical protein
LKQDTLLTLCGLSGITPLSLKDLALRKPVCTTIRRTVARSRRRTDRSPSSIASAAIRATSGLRRNMRRASVSGVHVTEVLSPGRRLFGESGALGELCMRCQRRPSRFAHSVLDWPRDCFLGDCELTRRLRARIQNLVPATSTGASSTAGGQTVATCVLMVDCQWASSSNSSPASAMPWSPVNPR